VIGTSGVGTDRAGQRFTFGNHFAQFTAQDGGELPFRLATLHHPLGDVDFGGAAMEDLRLRRADAVEHRPKTELGVGRE
jgi:hypothetical protein